MISFLLPVSYDSRTPLEYVPPAGSVSPTTRAFLSSSNGFRSYYNSGVDAVPYARVKRFQWDKPSSHKVVGLRVPNNYSITPQTKEHAPVRALLFSGRMSHIGWGRRDVVGYYDSVAHESAKVRS